MEKVIKIIGVAILISMPVWGQSSVDMPLVSDKPVAVTDSTVRIVDKDEIQRIVRDMAVKQKQLENRVVLLEAKVNNLESQMQGD